MSVEALLGLWADSMAVSILVWMLLLVVVLYAGRRWIEPWVVTLFQGLDRLLRFGSRSVRAAARSVDRRYRDHLRRMEREQLDHRLHRELRGLHDRVNRDLGGYPVLQRTLCDQIRRLEQDYHAAEDVPPAEPVWLSTVANLSSSPPQGDPAVTRVLEDIHDGMQRASRAALDQYQAASRKRLDLLKAMLPAWRDLGERLQGVEHAIQGVISRSRQVDDALARWRALNEGGPEMDVGLVANTVGRTLVSGALLLLMAVAAIVNFHLIERPMAEALVVTERVGPWSLPDVGAVLLILVGMAAGLLMTETKRLTSLVPVLGTLDLRARRWLFRTGLAVLVAVAALQGAMAFSRDLFLARDQVLALIVAGEPDAWLATFLWVPALTQMVMGLVLPLLLALAAVPLQAFLRHARVVLGVLLAAALHLLGFLLGFTARLIRWLARLVGILYGLLIFVPLKVEERFRQRGNGRAPAIDG